MSGCMENDLTACTESWQVAIVDSHIAEQLLGIVNQELQKRALDIVVQLLLKNGNNLFLLWRGG